MILNDWIEYLIRCNEVNEEVPFCPDERKQLLVFLDELKKYRDMELKV